MLRAFGSSIVETFDPLRAPMNETEFQRPHSGSLDDTETAHHVRWSVPTCSAGSAFLRPDRQVLAAGAVEGAEPA